ncbi:syntaxin-binding protein 5 isoform X3 [Tenebrio molitor]|uniref:syntaxin-binding protein 5 isoform X3 n=1 Tax=Tenebrio molitor TaxID=7067 RepID=UPI003624AB0C
MKRDKDPDRREVMKKFTFKGVLDNFRTSVAQPARADQEIQETLRPENFQVKRTFRHGFPFQPTAMAFDPVQRLLAIGSKCGSLRILGQPGVDIHVRHDMDGPPGSAAILHLQFLVNEGALVSATADDTLHLWNFRQKLPQIVQSLKFQKEKITCMHLPLQSKWLYVGTERGNVHVVHIESFVLSGYIINWNKAIEVSRKTHPGAIVHLSDNPLDASKLLIGYESGQIVLWDLRNKMADMRWQTSELKSIAWHYEGKQFMCSHVDGTLTTWSIKISAKYLYISQPHAKVNKDGKSEQCKPINKVEWKSSKTGEAYVIFSGGMPYDQAGRTPSITVVHSKTTTVLEMEHNVVDFITLCESPYTSELQEPYAIIALLQNDLVVMDLQTAGFPCLENPYPMDIHESPVTCCSYLADCPADLIPAMYSVGRAGATKRQGFSEMDWPISGGTWSAQSCSYSEVILTGHADGSIKFWDASAGTLQVLYKLKTAKIFEKQKSRSLDNEEDPLAIEIISLCPESRKLCVAGASSHVILFTYKKSESNDEVTVLEIPIVYEVPEEGEISPDCQFSGPGSAGSGSRLDILDLDNKKDTPTLKVRAGVQKKLPGFQAQLVCLTPWNNGESPSHITALTINSSYGLMAYGNEAGIVIIDIEQKVCLLNVGSPDLYGAQDPYSRVPRSPKKGAASVADILPMNMDREERQPRSPSIDQMGRSPESPYSLCPCPTPVEQASEAVEDEKAVPIPQAATRRKSSTWKGFNLKRQLSKVDIKIKNPLKEKRNSIFYSDISPEQESPTDDNKSSPDSDDNTVIDNQSVIDLTLNKEDQKETYEEFPAEIQFSPGEDSDTPFLVGSVGTQYEVGNSRKVGFAMRPDNLELMDENGCPVRPPRHVKKKIPDKRDQRLLSVPNIKFQKPEVQSLKDLRDREENVVSPQPSFTGNLMRRFSRVDKLDSSFSRSRSSSMSSLENITCEAIQCLVFADSFTRKSDPTMLTPTLWVGTSLGSVLTILITPPDPDSRSSQPVVVSLVGVTIFRLKGTILTMSFLDCNGSLIPNAYESWRDDNRDKREKTPTKCQNRMSPTLGDLQNRGDSFNDRQYVVIVSEKQARVVALPSQTCVYRQQLTDTDFVVKAEVISLRDSVCLLCYVSNGHLAAYSLPSLRPLIDIDFLPLSELRIARTFCFSNRGHGLYLTSPSELQKFTLCTEFCSNLTEMMGELFLPLDMPEAPKESFFKGLFGGGVRSLDREELFGESSGKANKSVAKHIPGSLQEMGSRVTTTTSEISRAHKLMVERGEKLGQLEDKAEKMRSEAENFSTSAHDLMLKYKDKKWYQL